MNLNYQFLSNINFMGIDHALKIRLSSINPPLALVQAQKIYCLVFTLLHKVWVSFCFEKMAVLCFLRALNVSVERSNISLLFKVGQFNLEFDLLVHQEGELLVLFCTSGGDRHFKAREVPTQVSGLSGQSGCLCC